MTTDSIFVSLANMLEVVQKNNLMPSIIMIFFFGWLLGQRSKHKADKRNLRAKKVKIK
jgi:hypothetical protein